MYQVAGESRQPLPCLNLAATAPDIKESRLKPKKVMDSPPVVIELTGFANNNRCQQRFIWALIQAGIYSNPQQESSNARRVYSRTLRMARPL